MANNLIERLKDKVDRQQEKVEKETQKLGNYRQQLHKAMFQSFINHQQQSRLGFNEALARAFGEKTSATKGYEYPQQE